MAAGGISTVRTGGKMSVWQSETRIYCHKMIDAARSKRSFFSVALRVAVAVTLVLAFSACGKIDISDIDGDSGKDGFTVRFNVKEYVVTDFDDVQTASKAARRQRRAARELGDVLNFAVFQDGKKVESVNQKSTDDDFGSISVNLAKGSYQVVALIHSCSGNATISSPEKITFPNNKVTDTFAYCSDLEVDGSADNDITVSRAVAKFRLTVSDDIPDNVETMEFSYTGGSSTYNAATGMGCVNSRQKEQRTVVDRTAGQTFEIYTFPHDLTDVLKVTVNALDKTGATVKEQVFENVPVEQNKVTSHTKNFFGGTSGETIEGDTHVVVGGDDAWTGEINY